MHDRAPGARPRVGALIPIRLSSERLPRKALAPVAGLPLVAHLIGQIRASRHVDPSLIVVCTTTDPADDDLVTAVEAAGGRVFRGDRDDLVDRLASACAAFDLEIALQVDGDDPLADPGYMDRAIQVLLDDAATDVAVVDGLPLGIASKAIRRRAFTAVRRAYRTRRNDTGFGYFFTRTGLCKVAHLTAAAEDMHAGARLTLDYPEDLEFFRALIEALHRPGQPIVLQDVLALLRDRPELLDLNAWRSEEYWQRTAELTSLEFEDPDGQVRRVEV
jgi:spore coat polysaccharide biosynthesis protein SpsF